MRPILHFIPVFLIIFSWSKAHETYTKINSKPDNVIFKYPREAKSERKLRECKEQDVCNVVHERFWLATLVERICRCPNGFECPWTAEFNEYSMRLNNRSLLKFCESSEKEKCSRKKTAAIVHGKINAAQNSMSADKIRVNCKCPKTHYWKLKEYTFEDNGALHQMFKCEKQTMCEKMEFCGYIRADFYSIYYRCACPEKHLCISRDRELENAQEFMYIGPSYKAYCLPWGR